MTDDDNTRSQSGAQPPIVCALGASAGGLAPLEGFFDAIPADTGMAFVVVQHLSPDHESLMDRLLRGHTSMPINQAEDGEAVMGDHVYLLPPGQGITIEGGRLRLSERRIEGREPPRPIDIFFGSLADDRGKDCIAIVLSGTGSDGSTGIEEVRRAGGLTLAQDGSAEFDGMPDAARRSGYVDASLAPAALAAACVAYRRAGIRPEVEGDHAAPVHPSLAEMIAILQRAAGISFTEYKPGTLRRRIERRVQLDADGHHDEYLDRLRGDPLLADRLVEEVLIDVTGFFRDRAMFGLLEQEILPRLVAHAVDSGKPIRVWSAGCATGQEAYSIGMLLIEACDMLGGPPPPIRIFATDVHEGSLRTATEGVYDAEDMAAVSPRRLDRFFEATTDRWRVRPELRATVTFTQHDLLSDAPFTAIDLFTCRNVLIYFQTAAQQRALRSANFALRPGGVLVLGSSETLGIIADDFEPVSEAWRVFRKRLDAARATAPSAATVRVPARTPALSVDHRLVRAYDAILDMHFVNGLLLNDRRELLHTIGGASEWLGQPRGRTTLDALSLVRDQTLRVTLGSVLRELERGAEEAESKLVIAGDERVESLRVSGRTIRVGTSSYYLLYGAVVVAESADDTTSVAVLPTDTETADYVAQVEAELAYTRESLQAMIEEQETSNEELNASNEELIAANEELQSTNEELSSVNEELRTLNDEHRLRLDQLMELSADLEQLMSTIDVGVVFLAEDRTIRRFNEPARDYFRVRDGDVGRPFEDITVTIDGVNLARCIDTVFAGGPPASQRAWALGDPDRRLMVRVDRYELPRSRSGVFIAVVDVSEVVVSREERAVAAFLQNSPLVAAIWTDDNRIRYRNRSVVEGEPPIPYSDEDAQPGPPELLTDDLVETLDRVRTTGEVSYLLYHYDDAIGRPASSEFDEFILVIHQFRFAEEQLLGALWVPTELVTGLVDLKMREAMLKALGTHDRVHSMLLDTEGAPMRRGLPVREEESRDEILAAIEARAADPPEVLALLERCIRNGRAERFDYVGVTPAGAQRVTDTIVVPMPESDAIGGIAFGVEVGDFVDRQERDTRRINELENEVARLRAELADVARSGREFATDLAERNADLDNFAHVAAHDLKAPIRSVRAFAEMAADEIPPDSPAQTRLERVLEASDRMTGLLEGLLDFASIDRRPPEPAAVAIVGVIDDLLVDLEAAIETSDADVSVMIAAGDTWFGDETGVRQILSNLVQNAIKYSDGPPVIRISSRPLDDGIVVDVTDEGIGFDQGLVEQAFEPFQRLHDMSVSGNGVGLAICRRIAERNRGRLWATSAVGQGSTFSVWLPSGDQPVGKQVGDHHGRPSVRSNSEVSDS